MTEPLARLDVASQDGAVVATVTGEVDLSNASDLHARLLALRGPQAHLVLDLGGVSYIDSAGLSLLDGLARELDGRGARLAVVAPDGCAAHRVVVLAGMAVDLYDDPARALASLP